MTLFCLLYFRAHFYAGIHANNCCVSGFTRSRTFSFLDPDPKQKVSDLKTAESSFIDNLVVRIRTGSGPCLENCMLKVYRK
jgi:hypothetical protein